ncbi:MAG: peptide deformylase [Pseudomonadota bacterium]
MSLREIVLWPDDRLSQMCTPVGEITEDVRGLAQDMLDTMYAAPGRGLAAPQVGVLARLFVMDPSWKEGTPAPVVCINPNLVWHSDATVVSSEGCLSLPGVTADVPRAETVRMVWTDLDGVVQEAELTGFAALCAQHEIDHLDGLMTLDRLADADRDRLLAAYEAAR